MRPSPQRVSTFMLYLDKQVRANALCSSQTRKIKLTEQTMVGVLRNEGFDPIISSRRHMDGQILPSFHTSSQSFLLIKYQKSLSFLSPLIRYVNELACKHSYSPQSSFKHLIHSQHDKSHFESIKRGWSNWPLPSGTKFLWSAPVETISTDLRLAYCACCHSLAHRLNLIHSRCTREHPWHCACSSHMPCQPATPAHLHATCTFCVFHPLVLLAYSAVTTTSAVSDHRISQSPATICAGRADEMLLKK